MKFSLRSAPRALILSVASLAGVATLGLMSTAQAETVDRHITIAETRPVFDYRAATMGQPVTVETKTADGKCRFKVELAGVQGPSTPGALLFGKVTDGKCSGGDTPVHYGVVRASAMPVAGAKGQQVKLEPTVDVVVFPLVH